MVDNLNKIIFKGLAQKSYSLNEYDFFKLKDYIINNKSDFEFDILLISFSNCYNYYLELLNNLDNEENSSINKKELDSISKKIKKIASLIEEFDRSVIINYKAAIKDLILTLFSNNDIIFSKSFCYAYSKVDPYSCMKILNKNKDKIDDSLSSLLSRLEIEYEQYENLSYEVETLIHDNIANFKYDFQVFDYLDFI